MKKPKGKGQKETNVKKAQKAKQTQRMKAKAGSRKPKGKKHKGGIPEPGSLTPTTFL